MKKVVITALALFVIAVAVSSCKDHEKCEAYTWKDGKSKTEQRNS